MIHKKIEDLKPDCVWTSSLSMKSEEEFKKEMDERYKKIRIFRWVFWSCLFLIITFLTAHYISSLYLDGQVYVCKRAFLEAIEGK